MSARVALVTGGGGAIGLAVARKLREDGHVVVLADLPAKAPAPDDGFERLDCDVRDAAAVERVVAEVLGRHGRLDVAVANAGISGVMRPITALSHDEWRAVLDVNLDGVFLTFKHAGAAMAAAGGGALVSVASVMGVKPAPLCGPYAVAKAGVIALTKAVAVELRDAGVRANAVLPGFVDTPLVRDHADGFRAHLGIEDLDAAVAKAQGRWVQPAEVAHTVAFLASDAASFVTGAVHVVDGGLSSLVA